jgi:hypothetical protein
LHMWSAAGVFHVFGWADLILFGFVANQYGDDHVYTPAYD